MIGFLFGAAAVATAVYIKRRRGYARHGGCHGGGHWGRSHWGRHRRWGGEGHDDWGASHGGSGPFWLRGVFARLDWNLPAIEVARWIRGLDSVPGAWSELNGEPVKFFVPRVEMHSGRPGEVLEAQEGVGVLIAAGRDAVRVREVQPAGKRRMGADEWIRGRGVKVGDVFA